MLLAVVQELEKSGCAALRNNIIVTMADFCVRYTALIDCYIAKITKCLDDPCELVRRQTFTLLSRLLQMDYVKWRGVLFLRFLLSLVDESEKIRQLADFLFGTILKAKAPLLAYNSFVEAVFVLNDCHSHMGHSSSQSSQVENKLFSIRGNDDQSRSKRMHIYVSLLKQMAPEHLLKHGSYFNVLSKEKPRLKALKESMDLQANHQNNQRMDSEDCHGLCRRLSRA
ncbi:hypothetical protein Droror1_Dr00010315 [Drosera rotundifolia]